MKFTAIIVFILITACSFGQSLSQEIDSIYNFQPGKLSDKEKESKFPPLDRFWDKVKSDTSGYLPQLRFELRVAEHNPFFYYDGSGLLLSLSKTKADKELAVQAIAKCNLDDISQKIYVTTLNKLAQEGIDVTVAAVKILRDDKFSFFLPQHAMTFDQGYCLTYMLLPQENNNYVDTLISLFPTVSTISKKSIITTLWFACSCKGDNFLKSIGTNQTMEEEVRDYVNKIMGYTKLSKDQQEYIKMAGREHLAEIRKMSLQRFSDEAIDELDMTTRILRSEGKCL
jgi:hypothetical protein